MNTNDIAFLLTAASFIFPAIKEAQLTSSDDVVARAIYALTDPPRVQVSRSGLTRTVRHGNGQLLRGISIGSFRYRREQGDSAHLSDPKYWADLKAVGINAIRLVAFDAWQRSHGDPGSRTPYPYTDLSNAAQTAAMLAEFDLIVDQAAAYGMAVMINYHDVGGFTDPDFTKPADANGNFPRTNNYQYVARFWNLVAPRYANRAHVFYELLNEPVQWSAAEYTATDIRRFKVIFDRVRAAAPKTHIVVCSFATHISSSRQRSMRDVALEMKAAGIDFSNASLGVHPYNSNFPQPNTSAPILDLMRNFTVINTEQNFPAGMVPGLEDPDASGLDGDRLGFNPWNACTLAGFTGTPIRSMSFASTSAAESSATPRPKVTTGSVSCSILCHSNFCQLDFDRTRI